MLAQIVIAVSIGLSLSSRWNQWFLVGRYLPAVQLFHRSEVRGGHGADVPGSIQ